MKVKNRVVVLCLFLLSASFHSVSFASDDLPPLEVEPMELYRQGKEDEAFQILSDRAMLGDPKAQSNLGVFYQRGIGTEVDMKKAFILFSLAAKQGNPYGFFNLAELFELGDGVEVDLDRAATLYEMAIGSPDADEKVKSAGMAAIIRIQSIRSMERHLPKVVPDAPVDQDAAVRL